MGDEFEKTTKNILGDEQGTIPTSIRQLSIGLDSYFDKTRKEDREWHDQVLKAITEIKTSVDNDCRLCKTDVQKNFNLIKPILSLAENPKLLKLILVLISLVVIMAFRGGHDYFNDATKLITTIK